MGATAKRTSGLYQPDALKLYRRHGEECTGDGFCECPIWCDGTLHGVRYRRSLGTRDPEEARYRMNRLLDGKVDGGKRAVTLDAAVSGYLDACRERRLAEATVRDYSDLLALLKRHLPGVDLVRVTTEALIAFRLTRRLGDRTSRKELTALRAFFNWCVSMGYLETSPAARIKMPHVEVDEVEPFEQWEVKALVAGCDFLGQPNHPQTPYIRKRAKALILTMLYTGLRASDIANLRWGDIRGDRVVLRQQKTAVPVAIPLPVVVRDALAALGRQGEYVLGRSSGLTHTRTNIIRVTLNRLGDKLGIRVHPHRFRDHFAVSLLTAGADLRTVQHLLGHRSIKTTERHYAQFVAAHQALLDSAVSRLSF